MCRLFAQCSLIFLGLAILLLAGCASPAQRLALFAERQGLTREVVQGRDFQHVLYHSAGEMPGNALHVYIEGDGRPWRHRYLVARDPTSRYRLALALMMLDSSPALYLGRPCYHGLARTTPCRPVHWTHQRYAEPVVASMAEVLAQAIAEGRYGELVLIGHSGGGTLAMLLAERIAQTVAVVTLAANLDIDAWTQHHRYSPLAGSLNPSLRLPLPPRIRQLHLVGAEDRNTPPWLISNAVSRQPNAYFKVIDDFNHLCCWTKVWPSVLKAVATGDTGVIAASHD